MIDFTPIQNDSVKMLEFSAGMTPQQLREASDESIDRMLALVNAVETDAEIAFLPHDPDANDPFATAGEEHIGWSVGHLIAHVTASSEEGAAFYSLLARGVELPEGIRLRWEVAWQTMDSKAKCVQRLEESRRMRQAYLDAAPDAPRLDVMRPLSERFIERFGQLNAVASFLFGLKHEQDHYEQMRAAAQQAKAARAAAG